MANVVDVLNKNRELLKRVKERLDEAQKSGDAEGLLHRLLADQNRDADTLDGLHADEIIRKGRMSGGEGAIYVDVTVPAETEEITVAHGLGRTPQCVYPEPQDNLEGRSVWITDKTVTHFTLHLSTSDINVTHSFRCRVS
jgi:hypothetical protein